MRKPILQKYISLSLLTGLLNTIALSQTPNTLPAKYTGNPKVNYVRTWEATAPEQNTSTLVGRPLKDVKQTSAYFDGLGRPLQTVVKKGSLVTGGDSTDLVAAITYDDFGREAYKYLPFAANSAGGNGSINDGLFKLNPFQQQAQFYNNQLTGQPNETNVANVGGNQLNWAYGQTTFEASPINRVQELFAAGSSWVGTSNKLAENDRHSLKSKYWINTAADSVRIWSVTDVPNNFGNYSTTAIYPAGELFKNIIVDERGKQIIEFKDKAGLVILKKIQLAATVDNGSGSGHYGWLCTYYVYDDLSRLRAVIQPRGVEYLLDGTWSSTMMTNILSGLCFRYEYDTKGRMVRKNMPDGGETRMVYDARDRIVLSQTAQLRSTNQWLVNTYDELNRPFQTWLITDPTYANDLSYHIDAADASISYPDVNSYATKEEISTTFYDNYKWLGDYTTQLSATYNPAYDIYFLNTPNSSWPYAQANVQSLNTTGLVTGTRGKVLGSTSNYLYSVNIYDSKGRVIQVQSNNFSGGEDYVSTQYSWSGQPLVVAQRVRKGGINQQSHVMATITTYDELGRVLNVKKDHHLFISNTNKHYYKPEQTIAQHEYDALGQLKNKKLGAVAATLETITYDYNIRGWMLGANRIYAKDALSTANHFGFDLAYDKQSLNYGGTSITGNIGAMLWKSMGDGQIRRYDYTYDAASRLLTADFTQFTSNEFNRNAGLDFSTQNTYDANGNITYMKQMGWKGSSSTSIDRLQYNYMNYSNQLKNVFDSDNDSQTKLGDFRASSIYTTKTPTSTDYAYDLNGNMRKDLNKDIGSSVNNGINYNHLNLVSQVNVFTTGPTLKGTIKYYYDAWGNKLRKTVTETGKPSKTTLYINGAVFEDDTLLFISHEEGRMRFSKRRFLNGDSAYQFVYDYFLKDHLGNVRMVLTEQKDTAQYLASMEIAYRATEEQLFYNIASTAVNKSTIPGFPSDPQPVTNPNDIVAKVNGSGNKVGPAIVLKVMSGDKIDIAFKSFYKTNSSPGSNINPALDIISSLATGIVSAVGETKGTLTTLNGIGGPLAGAITDFRNSQTSPPAGKPKAYLNWILLDEQFKFVSDGSGSIPVGNADILNGDGRSDIPVTKNGFLYIYASNETQNWDVFFDNLSVKHYTGPLTEETHYYPFGLTMTGISSKAANRLENKKKYNGIEYENSFDLNIGEAFYRTHDPQIGRWWQIDPKLESTLELSPYAAMNNNPISMIDPLGDIVKYERGEGVTRKEFRKFKREIRQARHNSETFNKVYKDFKKDDRVFKYVAVNSDKGGETKKTEEGWDMSISIHGKDPNQKGDEKFSRLGQVAHESGHAWRKKYNLDPGSVNRRDYTGLKGREMLEAMNEDTKAIISGSQTREIGATHIENMILSELVNSGNFHGIGLRQSYPLASYKLQISKGQGFLVVPTIEDYNTLQPPRTKDYYLQTIFNIYKEHGVQDPDNP